ncbi:glycosyltransferase family 4 protein [Photobacterium kasasachensis]|uniref:glycosyltransferase family 4 protein n=1 Tax=Photobacterium kasasachensis TaxID=2910240 RepID=UPI003D14B5AE
MKILHFSESIKGGVATYLNLLDDGLSRCQFQNHYLVPHSHKSELDITENKLSFHDGGRGVSSLIAMFFKLSKTVSDIKPDVIYAHSTFAGLLLIIYKLFYGAKIVYCPHGWAVFREQSKIKKKIISFIEKYMSVVPDVIVDISRFEHECTKTLGYKGNKVCIPNSVKLSDEVKLHKADEVERCIELLFVGRFDHQKGLDIILDALEIVNRNRIKFKITLVGGSVLNSETKFNFEHPWITNVGWVSNKDIDAFYQKADLLVIPSRWEGFGLVVLEAYRNSTPVLSSTSGALPFLVDENLTGYVSEPNAQAFVERLETINLNDLNRMRMFCRTKAELQFNVNDFTSKHVNVINSLIS